MRRKLSPHGLFALHRERVGAPLASVALAWVLKQRGVTTLQPENGAIALLRR